MKNFLEIFGASVPQQPMMSLVIVEGNISAGKSTLCRDLATILDYELYLEPTETNPYLARVTITSF